MDFSCSMSIQKTQSRTSLDKVVFKIDKDEYWFPVLASTEAERLNVFATFSI